MNCENCKKPNPPKTCSGCHRVKYCNRECQLANWKAYHKKRCGKSVEDLAFEQQESSSASMNQIQMMQMLSQMALSNSPSSPHADLLKRLISFYDQVPDLHTEYSIYIKRHSIKGTPSKALKLLRELVAHQKAAYMTELCFYDMGRNGTNLLLKSPTTLFKIINSSENQKIEWYMQARMYDVYERKVATPYEFSLHHSFSNARARRERFQTGKVHVAVGFVDLSLLLEMDLAINDAKWGPFQFIGYEASAFSVAKTMVIASMLKRSDKMICDAILQVWYSSCWSTDTLEAFREAVSEAKLGCIDDNVLALLKHWAKSNPQSVNYAQNRWLQKIDTSTFTSVVNALKLESRNTLSQYFLSGQLLPGTVASIPMFEAPTSLRSSRSRNESVFHSLDYSQLIDATKKNNNNFVSGAISILRSKIARLNKLIVSGKVNVVVKPPAIISPAFPKVIKEISSLNPYSISWNNCLDYLPREKFHTLARACSAAEDTIHFGYSMNWPGDVKGGSCLSFPVGEHFHEIMKTSRLGISLMYTMLGVNGLLRDPPIDNPINIFDISARTQCYKYWTKHFFENVPNIGQIEPSIYSVFSRSNSSLFLTWSYDNSIKFYGISQ